MSEHQHGKGDKPRPLSVDHETYAKNWDTIFGKTDVDWCEYSNLPTVTSYVTPTISSIAEEIDTLEHKLKEQLHES